MSRSYKSVPIRKDTGKYTYQDKRNANKSVRNTNEIQDGGSFKKCFCSYDISDSQHNLWTWEEARKYVAEADYYMKQFYKYTLKKPYIKESKTKKDLQREFYKIISK